MCFRLILGFYCIFMLSELGLLDETGIRIPLFRQNRPRQNALNSPNLEHHGIDLKWLTKPHKHNHTNDSVALFRYLDNEFYGKVLIGTKGKTFNMVFDTAWSRSWVISDDCSFKTIGCWLHNKYDHHASSSYVANGTKFQVSEGSYNLTGYFSNDTFSMSHSRVDGQMFVEMTSLPYWYVFTKSDGVIGLGFKTTDYMPLFYNLVQQSAKKMKPIFSVYLSRDRQSSRGGNILLGFVDGKHIHQIPNPENPKKPLYENITYLDVDSTVGYWKFGVDRVTLDDTSKNKTYPFCTTGCQAFPDTSTNQIVGPKKEVDALHVLIRAKETYFGLYKVDCDTVNKLPPIDFVLAGKLFTLKGMNYIEKMSVGGVTFCISAFRATDLPYEENTWILGGAFLAEFYSVYDIDKLRIGFVKAA